MKLWKYILGAIAFIGGLLILNSSKKKTQQETDLKLKENERLTEQLKEAAKKVEAAKQKIADGTYGICEDCGAEISQKRLLARPTADLCIGCQEEKEKEKSVYSKIYLTTIYNLYEHKQQPCSFSSPISVKVAVVKVLWVEEENEQKNHSYKT